jgi:hypothetical protein
VHVPGVRHNGHASRTTFQISPRRIVPVIDASAISVGK